MYIFAFIIYLVSIILLLYYIGTKKKLCHFLPRPPPLNCSNLPLLLVFGEISKPPDYSVLESNNLKIELMQWQPHMVRGSSFDKNKNISLPKKRILEKKIKRFEV